MNEALREKTVFMRFFSPMYHHTRRTRRPKGVYKVIECTIEQGIVCSATCSIGRRLLLLLGLSV